MTIGICNVLMYEPEDIPEKLKISADVFSQLDKKLNDKYAKALTELSEKGFVRGVGDLPKVLSMENKHPYIDEVLEQAGGDEESYHIAFNSTPYEKLGKVQSRVSEFKQLYDEFAETGIPVVFFNTVNGRGTEFASILADMYCGLLPAIEQAKWVGTTSPRYHMSQDIKAEFESRARKKKGKTTTLFIPKYDLEQSLDDEAKSKNGCLVAIGDTDEKLKEAVTEITGIIYRRLVNLRGNKFGLSGYYTIE